MAYRFQLQFINAGYIADFALDFLRRLRNYSDTEKFSLGWNREMLLDRPRGHGPWELHKWPQATLRARSSVQRRGAFHPF
jgi:hypothetical protein